MLDYVYKHDEIVARFVAMLIPIVRERGFSPNSKTIGIIENGDLIAGIIYHNWEPDAGIIEMSGAALPGRNWLTRETLKRMFQYPFLQIGCQMVIMRVAAEDERVLRILAAYGFMFIKVPRMLGRERDGVLALLTREAWEENKFNKRLKHHLPEMYLQEAAE